MVLLKTGLLLSAVLLIVLSGVDIRAWPAIRPLKRRTWSAAA